MYRRQAVPARQGLSSRITSFTSSGSPATIAPFPAARQRHGDRDRIATNPVVQARDTGPLYWFADRTVSAAASVTTDGTTVPRTDAGPKPSMADWITSFIAGGGYWAIMLLMALENVFPPIPSELIMPFAGAAAGRGDLDFALVVAAGTIGSLAGTLPWYWVGYRLGSRRLKRWTDRHGRWITTVSYTHLTLPTN